MVSTKLSALINIYKGKYMYYTIYKTTNLINDKYYIGKHQTENLNDGYMGSGAKLIKSIKKYGKENFKKEILYAFHTEQDMNNKEKELVNEELVKDKNSTQARKNALCRFNDGNINLSEETKMKISLSLIDKKQNTVKCPHCHKLGGERAMKRWHFENCKNLSN